MPLAPPIKKKASIKQVKEILYRHGEKIHDKCKKGDTVSGEVFKAMKCGLYCIWDLSEHEGDLTRNLFDPEVWSKLVDKYKKHVFKVDNTMQSLEEKWEAISGIVIKDDNNIRNAQQYISLLRSMQNVEIEKQQLLDFYGEILYLLNSSQFLLDPANQRKVSERDFAYLIWLPLFKRLFCMNDNFVRIKVGETVLCDSTSCKSILYPELTNVIGFKVDIRILFDFKNTEFDLVAGEACISLQGLDHDSSKLLKKGKIHNNKEI
jgi:hypothetical protein